MSLTGLSGGRRRAKKPHQCFHCYRMIGAGEVYWYEVNKYDGHVYELKYHPDCKEAADRYQVYDLYGDEGYPPLRDDLAESGEYQWELDRMRGHFPHVVCRMELTDQLRRSR